MRFDKGWVKIWRIDDTHWLYKDNFARHLWWDLIVIANYKSSRLRAGKEIRELPPGTIVTSRSELAERLGVSEKPIRDRLDMFEKDKMIVQQKSSRGTIITICNWSKYQNAPDDEGQEKAQRKASVGPAEGQPRASGGPLSEEDKKERMEEGKNKKDVVSNDASLMLADIWNNNTSEKFPKVAKLNDKRLSAMRKAFKEHSVIEDWEMFAISLDKSKFHRGENDRKWVADFDWFIRSGNIIKFIEKGKK